ncbi:membrane protein [Planctomycetales bacterium]|nr:membrane protein [Planctomycetales bacterium]
MPAPAFAQHTPITISGDVTGSVFGNGTPPNGTTPPATATVTDYSVIINSGGNVTAMNNRVTINGGTVSGNVYGGDTGGGDGTNKATGNTVNIKGGSVVGNIYGGRTTNADMFTGNTLNLAANNTSINSVQNFEFINFTSEGDAGITTLDTTPTNAATGTLVKMNTNANTITFGGDIIGGGGIEKTGTGTLTLSGTNNSYGNTLVSEGTLSIGRDENIGTGTNTLAGGTLRLTGNGVTYNKGWTLEAQNGAGQTAHNVIDVEGNNMNGVDFDGALIDGTSGSGGVPTLTQLDVHGSATYSGDLDASGGTMNFYIPTAMGDGATMLTVDGNANISNSQVNVGIEGATTALKVGEQIKLIDTTGTLTADGINKISGMQGVSVQYEFDLTTTTTQLLATVRDAALNPQTKSYSEARLSQLAFANQGSDLIAGQGLFAALDTLDTEARRGKNTTVFGALSGGSSRYKTGSHSDVTGVSLIAGLTGCSQQTLGKLTLGAFFEYGNANYDSYNSFVNAASVNGKGDIDYTGGGVLAHLEFNPSAKGNAWLESSARFGRATVDFKTGDMFDNKSGQHAAFASDSNYAAAHIGLGYHWNLTKRNGFDIYAQYLWSRQNADTAELTTGETIRFETANSERLRLGSRFIYNLNPHRRAYAGIAWEHEFDGEANASIYGFRLLDTPKLTGDTCKLELGLTLQPTKTCPVTRNLGVQGYTGKREGVAGSVEVKYEF